MSARLRADLAAALTTAMRTRDRAAVAAVRSALAAVANAEAVPVEQGRAAGAIGSAALGAGAADVARRELTDAEVLALVTAEVDERMAAAAVMTGHGRADEAQRLHAEADALRAVLATHG